MAELPEEVKKAWDDRKGAIVLTTVCQDGTPNSIWASCVSTYGSDKIVVADNFFNKTRENIEAGTKASVLLITAAGKSYQIKGPAEYHTAGEIFDNMKSWNGDRPGHAAAVVNVEEVYSGADRLV
jgi:hypothetical protein